MKLAFFCDTSSWTTGKALAISNGVYYDEEALDHQVIEAERIKADLDELNEIIREIPIVGGNSEDETLNEEDFANLKDYLKRNGQVVHERETEIIVEDDEEAEEDA